MTRKVFTHIGTLRGDARTGGRQFRTKLRLTPSGSHWVDINGRRYRKNGGGYAGDRWPLYFLDASSIMEITASGMEAAIAGETPQSGSTEGDSPTAESGDAQTPPGSDQ